MKFYASLFALLTSISLFGQEKKKLDHTAYDEWSTISAINQSENGQLVSYEITPYDADGNLFIEKIDGSLKHSISRGTNASITSEGSHVVYLIKPEKDTIRKLKLDKVKKNKLPKDTLAIYSVLKDTTFLYSKIKSYQLSDKGNWLAFLSYEDLRMPCPEKKKKCWLKKKNKCSLPKTSGTTLFVMNLATGDVKKLHGVTRFLLGKENNVLSYIQSKKGKVDSLTAHQLKLTDWTDITLLSNQVEISHLTYDKNCFQLAFYSTTDTNKLKNQSLYYWDTTMQTATLLVDSTTLGMPKDYTVSKNKPLKFSWDGTKLFLETAPILRQIPKDTLLDNEKVRVDIWGGNDNRIQPHQLSQVKRDKNKTYKAVYNFSSTRFIQLENKDITTVKTFGHGNANKGLGYCQKPYQKAMTWDYPWKRDIYITDLTNGEHQLIKKGHGYSATISPSNTYFLWYEATDSNWYKKDIATEDSINLTASLNDLFATEANGYPILINSEGYHAWTKINEEEYLLINSRFDVWAICPSDYQKSFCLTNHLGRKNHAYLRLTTFDTDSTYISLEDALIHGVDSLTKSESYYQINKSGNNYVLKKKITSPHKYFYLSKAKSSNQILFRRKSFTEYPEILSSTTNFESLTTLTHANPQQKEYNWGTVEMIEWTSFKGIPLRGLLYKPEDFDSSKSYPMLVYFYETYTQDLHNYYAPKPTASIIYPTEYVSNGYIVFIPDIKYAEPGYPARSAYDCIVSGTDYLTQKHSWIDSTRLGLQGQSWGGYQTAQLITMTTKYSAAMAGAPVGNMFSAYGGVRWTSGLSRMFQYERGQSRIGYTIWEKPELYYENSPIFGLPNVKTPLLIMHNDGDGAVPWYQGIEIYMGLRRLGKPVWLLNYNGDAHNLMRIPNRRDLSIRMRQFFDHYLLNAKIPVWMDKGIPAVDKGLENGLELKK